MRQNVSKSARSLHHFLFAWSLISFIVGIDTAHYQRLNLHRDTDFDEIKETSKGTSKGALTSTSLTASTDGPTGSRNSHIPRNIKSKKLCRGKDYTAVISHRRSSELPVDVLCARVRRYTRRHRFSCTVKGKHGSGDESFRTKHKPKLINTKGTMDGFSLGHTGWKSEPNRIFAWVGDNVSITCDVPEIQRQGRPIWRRNGIDLESLEEIRVENDGSLYLAEVQLMHAGNYSCYVPEYQNVTLTYVLVIHTIPEVRVEPQLQWKRPRENVTMRCHVVGEPFPYRLEWIKNHRTLRHEDPDRYEIVGNATRLVLRNVEYADTGSYTCAAVSYGGVAKKFSSLLVSEYPMSIPRNEEFRFFTFHEWGITVHEPLACRLRQEIRGRDIIPGTQEHVCGTKHGLCSWGRAVNVGDRYIYVSQPNQDRILVINNKQMVVVEVINTDKYPVELQYVDFLDQIWLQNWRSEKDDGVKTIQIIKDAIQKKKHHAVYPEPIDEHTDLVQAIFIPEKKDIDSRFRYGYVTHKNQSGMYKLDLAHARYMRVVDLSPHDCVPATIRFSALYGFVVLECRESISGRATGQILLDYLTDTVIGHKMNLLGEPNISPNSRQLVTLDRQATEVTLVVQEISPGGLTFAFDVKTTLNISDIAFFPSQTTHGYDIYASSVDKEDILFVDLASGKVEMVTGVGKPVPPKLRKWKNTNRPIVQNGVFGEYIVSLAHEAVFVLNGATRSINCEIAGLVHPVTVVWTTVSLN